LVGAPPEVIPMIARVFAAALSLAVAVAYLSAPHWQERNPATPLATPILSPVASPVASPVGRSVSVARSVTILMHDGWFDPAYVEATNGHDLTITLVNAGARPHAFRIDAYRIDVTLKPGTSTTIEIHDPDLGDFIFYSDAPGDAGMKGQLTFYIERFARFNRPALPKDNGP
jgi:hypothetical protein